ncbi:MAG: BolA/IbaG family iron-sulfur metabolism protein [Gammaproteobacteria bacterium]|nr:BolA/IbaG family iron-sulfur metabolism protein [Gammaproteobacteria bacterium]MBU6510349.1 BolA/IbaG family iron-sulfur metabolism protein [Gammaproteobacteria bacterium]MDE1983827.1 BolA/IbaG family iron-sulfur metabolism protein [Gammaproteobacteria bacterium]MDE2108888.1 BolA/IbaG family iron-sulfur metabolism protein [Gammaproteobacteria bacterium]MDE2461285.1 BolA/IbaG family iron-sulfur metabolism protein [Gammaproteobacteria bacterium]
MSPVSIPRSPSLSPAEIEHLIMQGLPAAEVRVSSADGAHFEALIITDLFAGKRPLARHQLVYATLGERIGREIHALSLRTLTPDEWQRQTAA